MPAPRSSTPRAGRRRLFADRRGATVVEYGLIAALIVLAMIASLKLVAGATVGTWNNVQTKIGNAVGY